VPTLERISKTAAASSVLLILVLALGVHPDMTPTLRVLIGAALVLGWFSGSPSRPLVHGWIVVAVLSPAILRPLTHREGPVLDLVWMAGLAGGLLRLVPWSRWTLPPRWSVLIGGWALALSFAWPILVAREIGFDAAALRDVGAINSWAQMSAPQVVGWVTYVVLIQLLGALWFDWAMNVFSTSRGRIPGMIHALWMAASVASVVAIIQGTFDFGFLSSEFWASLRRATGTMLDANGYGMTAALAAPVAFLAVSARVPAQPAAVVIFAINWAGMWMSGSRTALLSGAVATGALVIGLSRTLRTGAQPRRTLAMWALVAALTLGLIAGGTVGPLRRMQEIPKGIAALATLWNRGGYGTVALRMTADYPLTGVGVGSYRVIAPDYWRTMANDALALDNAQNWWRHQIAELGVFGGAPIIAFSLLVGWRVFFGRRGHLDVTAAPGASDDLATVWTVRGLLLGLAASSLFGMATQSPVVLIWMFSLVAWLLTLLPDVRSPDELRDRRMAVAWIVACTLAVAYAAGHLMLARGSLSVAHRAERSHREYIVGAYPPEPLPNANEFRWTKQNARFVWPAKTRWIVVRFWAHHPDIATNPVRVTVSSPCGVLFDETISTMAPIGVGITLPEGLPALAASLHVSRTWKPSSLGGDDDRDLGVGIVADFLTDPALALAQHRTLDLSACRAGI
jgi:hypothetical protein